MKSTNPSGGCLDRIILLGLLLLAGLALMPRGAPDPVSAKNPGNATNAPTPEWWVDADIEAQGVQRCHTIKNAGPFHVNVGVRHVQNFNEFQFSFHFDGTYVTFSSFDLTPLLTSAEHSSALLDVTQAVTNSVMISVTLDQPVPAALESATLTRLTFRVKNPQGQTGLDIDPDPNFTFLRLNGSRTEADADPAKAQVVIDSTAQVGCWTVNTTADLIDQEDSKPDGICDRNPALGIVNCTLREAIREANEDQGASRISFQIPNASLSCPVPCTIVVGPGGLPALSDKAGGTTIDGTTQPNIVVDGTAAGPRVDGFLVTSANNVICGLTIHSFAGAGVRITGNEARNNLILGNVIKNNAAGAIIFDSVQGDQIGGGAVDSGDC